MLDKDFYKDDPIMEVIRANRLDDIDSLHRYFFIEKKINILVITEKEHWNWLHRALMKPSSDNTTAEVVQFYIDHGVPINAQDVYGMTPLHYAMRSENAEAAIALLKAGADPNIPNRDNLVPLSMIGYMPERLDVLQLMLDSGGNVNLMITGRTIVESYKQIGRAHV